MSSLETSITLEDVFAVVAAKRVPLAAELAGYLALEIADGTDAGSGDVDPKTVFISEEGSVALVRPKKDVVTGDAEASVRTLLTRLLDAGGSSTPALGQAARRKPGNGLPALVEELEAALIPVNRAAGRRALARLSREVKRVTQGVGRNASIAPVSAPPKAAKAVEAREPPSREPPPRLEPEPKHDPLAPTPIAPKPQPALVALDPIEPSPLAPPAILPSPTPPPIPEPLPPRPKNDDVDALLSSFEVSGGADDKQLARDLKGIAGLSPTPPHPRTTSLADLADDVGKDLPRSAASGEGAPDDSVAALLAMADASLPAPEVAPAPPPAVARETTNRRAKPAERDAAIPAFRRTNPAESIDPAAPTKRRSAAEPPRAPKTSMTILVLALVGLAAATVAIYRYAPHVFVGHKPLPPPSASVAPTARAAQCKLTLQISDAPAGAEILLRVGQAPVDVDHMPVGARLELVATAEGYAPRRAVIAAESQWDKGPDGKPRIEIPIQLDASKPKPGTTDKWPAAEPNSQVGGSGAPGTVHVVSNVRGAEIWLLAGLGPDPAKMEQKCEGDVDVLIAGPNEKNGAGLRKRLHVSDKEIAAAAPDSQGNKSVSISASR